ncbi:MAG: hypothetical protein GY725_25275 [bacterium]|nr:hypothetical protein [bacterium]
MSADSLHSAAVKYALAVTLVTALSSFVALPVAAQVAMPKTTSIVEEVANTVAETGRVINAWWLPPEYWVASAREQKMSASEIDEVRRVFDDYLIIGVVEATVVADAKPRMTEIAEFVKRSTITVNLKPFEVLREVNPRLAELAPKLIYPLKASLSLFGDGLRLLPINNTDPSGKPILLGGQEGELRLEYRIDEARLPIVFRWRAPLSSVAGTRICPTGGEDLEANWNFCPYHGAKLPAR